MQNANIYLSLQNFDEFCSKSLEMCQKWQCNEYSLFSGVICNYVFVAVVLVLSTALELILECGRKGEARRAESGGSDSWGGDSGQPAPPHQPGDLQERCKLPQQGPGQSPGRQRVFLYSVPSDCLSQRLSMCCIQFAWLGIRFLGRLPKVDLII